MVNFNGKAQNIGHRKRGLSGGGCRVKEAIR